MLKILVSALGAVLLVSGCQPSANSGGAEGAPATQPVSAELDSGESSEDAALAVATIGDRTITAGELDDYIKDELFTRESSNRDPARLYSLRSGALERLIDRTIVLDAAAKQGISAEDYLDQTTVKADEIPDEEIAAYYENNKDKMGDATLEQIGPRIRSFLRTQRAGDVVAKLRTERAAVVLLEPARIDVAATGASLGPDDAPVTIIEFSDFQCPFCKRVVPTVHQITEKYPEQVRFVYRHLPLDRIHDRARPAAEAAACANKQNGFWAFHDLVFENNHALADEDLKKYAVEAGLDGDAFEACVASREFQADVQRDTDDAKAAGVSGTPAFFVNGIPRKGAVEFEELSRLIETELASETARTAPAS